MTGWQPIETAPKDGTPFEAKHSRADYPPAEAQWDGTEFSLSHFFVSAKDRLLYRQPDLWRPSPPSPEKHDDKG